MVFSRSEDEVEILERDADTENKREFGKRKFIHIGINKQPSSSRLVKSDGTEPENLPNSLLPELSAGSSPAKGTVGMKAAKKQWVHPPETLIRGHIVYNVKFLGECEVESAKGTDVVKEAIRKRKFNKHIRKAEGQKTPKVELTISADGVTVQDPKTKMIMHQYALHRISYCADDKSDKRMFTFIAKAGDCDKHFCYVFDSEKCAEEITLTIGQAFDLAYRRFLETSSRDFDMKKNYLLLQKKVQALEKENLTLKLRIKELEKQESTSQNAQNHQISSDHGDQEIVTNDTYVNNSILSLELPTSLNDESTTDEPVYSEIQPKKQTSVGRKLENLLFEPADSPLHTNGTSDFNTSATSNGTTSAIISPPPPSVRSRSQSGPQSPLGQPLVAPSTQGDTDAFGATPFGSMNPVTQEQVDPFGMPSFSPNSTQSIDQQLQNMDKDFLDLQAGFSQGLSFGSEDFSLADLDPLSQK